MNQPLASPSLWKPSVFSGQAAPSPSKRGAFEIKFLIDESRLEQMIPAVEARMLLDPHADPRTGGYSVEGIYYETQDRDVFRRTPGYSRRKYRIRRYAEGPNIFLERKSKRKGMVTKRRIQLEEAELAKLIQRDGIVNRECVQNEDPSNRSSGQTEMDWFSKRIDRLKLRPTLCIAYDRVAFLQMDTNGPIRLTIDRGLGCCQLDLSHPSTFPSKLDYQRFLEGNCIVEFKYRESLPSAFRELMEEFKLVSQPVSKYRNAIVIAGLAADTDHRSSQGAV